MSGKKGMKQQGWGSLRKLPSGRWHSSYVGPDLARHNGPITYTAKMDAQAWLISERRLIERQEWTSPATRSLHRQAQGITVAEYVSRWIEQRDLKDGPRYDYGLKLEKYVRPTPLGKLPMSAVTPQAVRGWYAALDPSKPSARAAVYSMLSTVMNQAVRDGIYVSNPVNIEGARTAKKQRTNVVPSPAEILQIAANIEDRLSAWILLASFTGIRIGEACEIRRKDLDLDAKMLHVTRGMRHIGGKCVTGPTKTEDERHLDIPAALIPALRDHLDRFVGDGPEALVFASVTPNKCGHLSQDRMRSQLRAAIVELATATGMVPHDMRHFQGTTVTVLGFSQAEVMARLGHKSTRAASIYQHAVRGTGAKIAEALSKMAEVVPQAA